MSLFASRFVTELSDFARRWQLHDRGVDGTSERVVSGLVHGVHFRLDYCPSLRAGGGRGVARDGWLSGRAQLALPLDLEIPPTTPAHAERLRLLWTPALSALFAKLSHVSPFVDNHGVGFRNTFRGELMTSELDFFPPVMLEMLAEMDRVRPTLPVAPELEPYLPAWTKCAERYGLQLVTAPLCVHGEYRGTRIWCSAARMQAAPTVVLRVSFGQPLDLGLELRQMGLTDKIVTAIGGQDVKTGDEAFDRRFRVQCDRPDAIQQALDAPVRERILKLSEDQPVCVDDVGLSLVLEQGLSALEDIETLVANAQHVISAIETVARPQPADKPDGPYR